MSAEEERNGEEEENEENIQSRLFEMIAREEVRKNKKYSSADAIGAYCTECESRITFTASNPSNVARHMNAKHKDKIDEYMNEEKSKKKRKYWGAGSIAHHFPSKQREVKKKASHANQKFFQMLTTLWTCKSLRPFAICEDSLLQEMIAFSSSVDGTLNLPSRNLNRENVMKTYKFSKMKLEELLHSEGEMEFFSCTSDIWSSRTMEAFVALTIHYLTDTFDMKKFVLKVDPIVGKHTAGFIREIMEKAFDEWNLDVDCLSMMLRDSGSNMVKACSDWGISHFACVGHSLHLVVGPLLVIKRKKKSSQPTEAIAEIAAQLEVGDEELDDAFDDDDELWDQADLLQHVRDVVGDFRKATKFLKNSTKCKELLEKIQVLQSINNVLNMKLDVRTRWNSTYHMLLRMEKLLSSIIQFESFYRSPRGKKEFQGIKTKFPELTTEKWALIKGLRMLLKPFDTVTKYLSGEKYPSFAAAMPLLREIKKILSNTTLFDMSESACTDSKKFKLNFKRDYGQYPFFNRVVTELEQCRVFLFEEFVKRFTGVDASILWSSLLDPRFASATYLSELEKERAKELLQDEVLDLVMRDWNAPPVVSYDMLSSDNSDDEDFTFNWAGSNTPAKRRDVTTTLSPNSQRQKHIENETVAVKHEVQAYIRDASASANCDTGTTDPLLWWRDKRKQYPRVSLAARKWLSVCSTSTPSERVFSICGIVNSAKRSRMNGNAIAAQVCLYNNLDSLNLSESELLASIST